MKKLFRCLLLLLLCSSWRTSSLLASVEQMKCPMGRDYDLYLPKKIDPNRTYWLVCYVHGSNGAACDDVPSLQHFVEQGDCIGVAPSFAHGFQLLKNGTDAQLIGILHQLSEKYKLHPKLFVYGHSAGSQFSHRFTMRHPDLVVGCEACSSGTWATGGIYQSPNLAAQNIPIAIACGADDVEKRGAVIARIANGAAVAAPAVREHPFYARARKMYQRVVRFVRARYAGARANRRALIQSDDPGWTRIEWFEKFSQMLQQESFFFKAKTFSGEQHNVQQREQTALAMESFLLGTSGMLPEERATYDSVIAAIEQNRAEGKSELVEKGLQQLQEMVATRSKETLRMTLLSHDWHINEAALGQCLRASKEFVDEEIMLIRK
ncbi:MAG: hypothetical protein FJ390_05655 [Verrucomicrobia bacterium]|nr:hypothetical protein [Verrucomicrobiota bacterium]